MLRYGKTIDSSQVRCEAAFSESQAFVIARIFANCSAGGKSRLITGHGGSLQPEAAAAKSFGEFVERLSAWVYSQTAQVTTSTAEALRHAGHKAVSPADLQHMSSDVAGGIGAVEDTTRIAWVAAQCLFTNEPAYVPALVSLYQWQPAADEPVFVRCGASGLAAHVESHASVRHGLLERFERDALVLSWRVPGWPVIKLDSDLTPAPYKKVLEQLDLDVALYAICPDGVPPTVLALVYRAGFLRLTCGSACGAFGPELIGRSITEALLLQWTMRKLSDLATTPQKCPKTFAEHVAYGYQNGPSVAEWYRQQSQRSSTAKPRFAACPANLSELLNQVRSHFPEAYSVDLTTPEARDSGWHVTRAIVPHAILNEYDHEQPHTGGHRFERALSLVDAKDKDIHTAPHPFG